jgi:hypothetical protein
MTKNQRQTQKWSSRIREPENPRIEKTAKPKNWQKKSGNFLNASLSPLVEFIMFFTNFAQPPG